MLLASIRQVVLIVCLLFFATNVTAQPKLVNHFNQIWGGYLNQTRLSKHWGFWAETQLRTHENFVENVSVNLNRIGATYYINDDTKLTAGYAFINSFSPANGANIATPEHRLWQQIQWHTKYPKIRLMQWLRVEERFRQKLQSPNELDNSFAFNCRVRYNFLMQVPLGKKMFNPKGLSFIFNNEIHVNFGKEIVYNTFDQNRFFLGFAYQTNKTSNLQFGYMNLFTQQPTGNVYRSLHVARVYYFHNIDLRKNK